MLEFDEYEPAEALPAIWATYKRERLAWADTALWDEMNRVRWIGWQPPPEIQVEFDRLAAEESEIDQAYEKTARIRSILADEMEALMSSVVPFPMPSHQPTTPPPVYVKSSAEFVQGFIPPDYVLDGVLAAAILLFHDCANGRR